MLKLIKKTQTQNNNAIELFMAGDDCPGLAETVLLIGVFHGDEPEGEVLIHKLMEEMEIVTSLPMGTPHNDIGRILFIPCLCPDGKELKTRTNANGVDLNRNFPTQNWALSGEKDIYYSGDSPASEIETRFLMEVIEEFEPARILAIHAPYKVVNFDGPAQELAREMSELNGYPVQEHIGYATPGSFGTYVGIERNIPTITLELPENECIEKLWEDNREAFYYFLNL